MLTRITWGYYLVEFTDPKYPVQRYLFWSYPFNFLNITDNDFHFDTALSTGLSFDVPLASNDFKEPVSRK